jgi:hypothetical protein
MRMFWVEGPAALGLLVALVVIVFLMVSFSENRWHMGMGAVAAVSCTLFCVFNWSTLADYPATYTGEGDRPKDKMSGGAVYLVWEIKAGENVTTSLVVDAPADSVSLAAGLYLEHGCEDVRVDWRIHADDQLLTSGTLLEGREHDLSSVPVPADNKPLTLRLNATRADTAACATVLSWENPGLEGPGNGQFRYVFPGLPEGS